MGIFVKFPPKKICDQIKHILWSNGLHTLTMHGLSSFQVYYYEMRNVMSNRPRFSKPHKILAVLFMAFTLSACLLSMPAMRDEAARRIAMPVFMYNRVIPAGIFELTAYERVHDENKPVTIYIEGGTYPMAYNRSYNPTPTDPVALRLAAQDPSPNVIYLARPCQYTTWDKEDVCPYEYYNNKRFAPDVIETYNQAIDNVKRFHRLPDEINLVGFNGGATIAAILAAERKDVVSLRTVAGNLDHRVFTDIHEREPFEGSLNAVDFAPALMDMPQHHFIGQNDTYMPPAVFHSYAKAMQDSRCLNYTLVKDARPQEGWVEQWQALLKEPTDCRPPLPQIELAPVPFDPSTLDEFGGPKEPGK